MTYICLIDCGGPVWAKMPGMIFLSQSTPGLYWPPLQTHTFFLHFIVVGIVLQSPNPNQFDINDMTTYWHAVGPLGSGAIILICS